MDKIVLETHKRSLLKTISWRVVAMFITAAITWVFTGRLDFAITVGLGDTLVKFLLYYLHERAWARSRFGVERPPEYEI